jgi:hypothetical protein
MQFRRTPSPFLLIIAYMQTCINSWNCYKNVTYGGPDGELAASLRYLSQRFSMPTKETRAILNDIGTEGAQ